MLLVASIIGSLSAAVIRVTMSGADPDQVIQELLRHANLKVAMDTYVQAVSDEKRKAQSKVVKMLLPGLRKREAV
jgi:integrase